MTDNLALMQVVFDNMPYLVWLKDQTGKYMLVNKAFMEFCGQPATAIIGRRVTDIFPELIAAAYQQADADVLRNHKAVFLDHIFEECTNGSCWFDTYVKPLVNEQGEVWATIGYSRKISKRKRLEQQLQQRERETQRELELAARVQRNTLPPPLHDVRVRVNSLFVPFHTVSGDLFNYKWFAAQQRLCGYLVDVSGHGLATALQTATVKMLLDTTLLNDWEITEADFQFINQKMTEYLYEESFAGVLYFSFDFQRMRLKVISGGISFFLANYINRCELVPVFSGFLGMFDEADIETVELPFKAGDIYAIISDGVSDLMEGQGLRNEAGLLRHTKWLYQLAASPERRDDFSAVNIEIIQGRNELNMVCTAELSELTDKQQCISDFLERHAPAAAFDMEIAINEALNNGLAVSEAVRVRIKRRGRRLVARITDSGAGFNVRSVRMPQSEAVAERLFTELGECERGRGLLLMHMLCDSVVYNACGNEVLLIKRLS